MIKHVHKQGRIQDLPLRGGAQTVVGGGANLPPGHFLAQKRKNWVRLGGTPETFVCRSATNGNSFEYKTYK